MARQMRNDDGAFRYRLPNLIGFAFAVVGMAMVTDLALATGPSASDWARDVVVPARWQSLTDLTRGFIDVESVMRGYFNFWAGITNGTSVAIYAIAVGAWIIHVVETIFALRKCIRYKASVGATLSYGVGVFLSGIAQFGSLNKEAKRVDRIKSAKKQKH